MALIIVVNPYRVRRIAKPRSTRQSLNVGLRWRNLPPDRGVPDNREPKGASNLKMLQTKGEPDLVRWTDYRQRPRLAWRPNGTKGYARIDKRLHADAETVALEVTARCLTGQSENVPSSAPDLDDPMVCQVTRAPWLEW